MHWDTTLLLIGVAIAVVAFLYSSVGHAGASGYIAVLTLAELAPDDIKPTALILNIFVATITSWQFARQGHFSWPLFWPFAVLAVPCALLGGYQNLPIAIFKILVGAVLVASAIRLLAKPTPDSETHQPALAVALPIGAALGLLSGLTGTGGGIFLTPLLLMMRWANTKTAAGVSAMFILVNSIAGLTGHLISTRYVPALAFQLAVIAVCAGFAGSYLGSQRFSSMTIKRLLAAVLIIAGAKLLMTPLTQKAKPVNAPLQDKPPGATSSTQPPHPRQSTSHSSPSNDREMYRDTDNDPVWSELEYRSCSPDHLG
jgi:uncharacterized protein